MKVYSYFFVLYLFFGEKVTWLCSVMQVAPLRVPSLWEREVCTDPMWLSDELFMNVSDINI